MYTNKAFGTVKCVLFIEVSLFQGLLIGGVPLYSSSLHFPMTAHVTILELSDVFLPFVSLREPQHFTAAMEMTFAEPTLVEHACTFLRVFTTRRYGG